MRNLSATHNIIEILDPVTGDVHEISYRLPTNDERVKYGASFIRRRGKKVQLRSDGFKINLQFGAAIITGFKKGTLGFDGALLCADGGDPDYRADWKELLCQGAPEIVAAVGRTVFAGATVHNKDDETGGRIEFEDVEDLGPDPLPPASSATCSAAMPASGKNA